MSDSKFTVGVIVNNYPGVLNRVSGLFSKRCYNIDSLAVGETEDLSYSRITIVCHGDEGMRNQVIRQLKKLHDVKDAVLLDETNSIIVEHMLAKIDLTGADKSAITALITRYGGRIVDFADGFITVEIMGEPSRNSRFIENCAERVIEIVRSGAIAIAHGAEHSLSVK